MTATTENAESDMERSRPFARRIDATARRRLRPQPRRASPDPTSDPEQVEQLESEVAGLRELISRAIAVIEQQNRLLADAGLQPIDPTDTLPRAEAPPLPRRRPGRADAADDRDPDDVTFDDIPSDASIDVRRGGSLTTA